MITNKAAGEFPQRFSGAGASSWGAAALGSGLQPVGGVGHLAEGRSVRLE